MVTFAPLGPNEVDSPDLLTLTVTPGAILVRRNSRNEPMARKDGLARQPCRRRVRRIADGVDGAHRQQGGPLASRSASMLSSGLPQNHSFAEDCLPMPRAVSARP